MITQRTRCDEVRLPTTTRTPMKKNLTRRGFIRHAAAGSAALTWLSASQTPLTLAAEGAKPALLGGTPVHQGPWPAWPVWRQSWEEPILEVLRSGRWFRGGGEHVADFESA